MGKRGRTGKPCLKIPGTYVKDSFFLADRQTRDSTQYIRGDSLPIESLKGPERQVLREVKKPLLKDTVSLRSSNMIHQA